MPAHMKIRREFRGSRTKFDAMVPLNQGRGLEMSALIYQRREFRGSRI